MQGGAGIFTCDFKWFPQNLGEIIWLANLTNFTIFLGIFHGFFCTFPRHSGTNHWRIFQVPWKFLVIFVWSLWYNFQCKITFITDTFIPFNPLAELNYSFTFWSFSFRLSNLLGDTLSFHGCFSNYRMSFSKMK